MLSCLHDIRNRLAVITTHTTLLAKKYGEEEFIPIKANISRINALINDAYARLQDNQSLTPSHIDLNEFSNHLDILVEALQLLYANNETKNFIVTEFNKLGRGHVLFNNILLSQILENAVINSMNAKATKVTVRLLEFQNNCIVEIVDNGEGFKKHDLRDESSKIPHGLGTQIMMQNMRAFQGKVVWSERLDSRGVVTRLIFPIERNAV